MNRITVIAYQSLFDLAIEKNGTVMAAFDIALANGLGIADILTPGQAIILPDSSYTVRDIAGYFEGKQQKIATANVTQGQISPELEGIDYWAIQIDFQVQ